MLKANTIKGYIRVIEIFEKYLSIKEPLLQKIEFQIQYVLNKKAGSQDFDVEVIFMILSESHWVEFIDEPRTLKYILNAFASIFSISKVRIVRTNKFNRLKRYLLPKKAPLSSRIHLELFSHLS